MRNNLDFNVSTKVLIKGFTINPNNSIDSFKNIVNGLCNGYKEKHICDFDGETIHDNYLGKQIGDMYFETIVSDKESGKIAFVNLDNGYFVIKIVDSVYPAEIQFDLYLDKKITDFQIIIDHLSAPPLPFDGFGMFDYYYNVSYFTNKESIISKENRTIPSYVINKKYNIEDHRQCISNEEKYSIVLNSLKETECYFCANLPKYSVFYGLPRKIIIVCEEHKDVGSNKELNHNTNLKTDIRNLGNVFDIPQYELLVNKDSNGVYGKNVKNKDIFD